MRGIRKLASAYLKYYKRQSLALLLGVLLSSALFTGIGSLLNSGRIAARENARGSYGDWHYSMSADADWYERFRDNSEGRGFSVEKQGVVTVRRVIQSPFEIQLVSADDGYLDMMGRTLLEGELPRQKNEVAMDTFTIRNLDIPAVVGSEITLDGETFILSGIVEEMPDQLGISQQAFVSSELDYGTNGSFFYVKFKETGDVYRQIAAFADTYKVDKDTIVRNNGLAEYAGGEAPVQFAKLVMTSLQDGYGFPYFWGSLDSSIHITDKMVYAALGMFGAFIIFGLFQTSVVKRMSQYSVMQTLGLGDRGTFGILAAELGMIFLPGYLLGALIGNGAASWIYGRSGSIFIPQSSTMHSSSQAVRDDAVASAGAGIPAAGGFHIAWKAAAGGAVFFFLLLLFISWILVRRMKRLTLQQMMTKSVKRSERSRRICSRRHGSLTGTVTKKFMMERKGAFAGMLFSLSVGGVIFLGTAYLTENTRINNELTFKADDGLGSDLQIYEDSDNLSDVIPKETAEQLQSMEELESVGPVTYMLGEILFADGSFEWPLFFPELGLTEGYEQDPEIMEKYNGIAVQTGEDDYRIKVNIYGYDDEMLGELGEYLLDGELDPDAMRENNTVIFKTLMDGQGNYDAFRLKPGDEIVVKTPKEAVSSEETAGEDEGSLTDVLRFQAEESMYREQPLTVAAIASRPLAKTSRYLKDNGTSTVDLIMTNEQMEQNFGVTGYHMVSISLREGVDADAAGDQIRKTVSGISNCVVKDYTEQIAVQNLYLKQKMLFFCGVAGIILVISLLHIMNSMQYMVAARKHEFGILRAMGITDSGFRKMLLQEGIRYGIYSGAVMTAFYLVVHKILYYYMQHVFLYLHPEGKLPLVWMAVMICVDIGICAAAVLLAGEKVLKEEVVDAIRE